MDTTQLLFGDAMTLCESGRRWDMRMHLSCGLANTADPAAASTSTHLDCKILQHAILADPVL